VVERYNAEVERLMAEHKCSRMLAFGKLATANPTLNREYLDFKRQQTR
jgi:hypothetical protein